MKQGVRALGVAESYQSESSTLAGVVVRADRIVDGFVFGSCTVGGTDATAAIIDLFDRLGRDDVQYLLLSGIAPAWYNIVDLGRLHEGTKRPVLAVSYEESSGLEDGINSAFDGAEATSRLETYRSLPDRKRVAVAGGDCFVRAVGIGAEEAVETVRTFTPEGGRPEPLRIARLAARAVDQRE